MSWKVILSGDLPRNRVCFSLYCGEEKMKSFYIGTPQVFVSTSLLICFFLISPTQSGFSGWSRVLRMILSTAPFISFTPTLIKLRSQNPLTHILSSKVHFCAKLHPWGGHQMANVPELGQRKSTDRCRLPWKVTFHYFNFLQDSIS